MKGEKKEDQEVGEKGGREKDPNLALTRGQRK